MKEKGSLKKHLCIPQLTLQIWINEVSGSAVVVKKKKQRIYGIFRAYTLTSWTFIDRVYTNASFEKQSIRNLFKKSKRYTEYTFVLHIPSRATYKKSSDHIRPAGRMHIEYVCSTQNIEIRNTFKGLIS